MQPAGIGTVLSVQDRLAGDLPVDGGRSDVPMGALFMAFRFLRVFERRRGNRGGSDAPGVPIRTRPTSNQFYVDHKLLNPF